MEQQKNKANGDGIGENVKEIHHYHYPKKGISFARVAIGISIIFIGFLMLAKTINLLPADFSINFNIIWPFFIIILGLILLTGRGLISNIIGGIAVLCLICFIIIALVFPGLFSGKTPEVKRVDFSYAQEDNINKSIINIKDGAGEIKISGNSKNIVEGVFQSNFLNLEKTEANIGQTKQVDLKINGKWNGFFPFNMKNELALSLNKDLPTELNIETGASKIYADLSDNNVEKLDISSGASDIELKASSQTMAAKYAIGAGASSIKLTVPQNIGVKVSLQSGASSQNMEGFTKLDDKNYKSSNYDESKQKLEIDVKIGASSFQVNWSPAVGLIEKEANTEDDVEVGFELNPSMGKMEYTELLSLIKKCQIRVITQKSDLSIEAEDLNYYKFATKEPVLDDVIKQYRALRGTCPPVNLITE